MTWQLHVPHRDRSDSLLEVVDMAEELPDPEDRATTRALAMDAYLEDRLESAGELLDRIERADPAERRSMLDRARVSAGLLNTKDERDHRAFVATNGRLRVRPPQQCAVCGTVPTRPDGLPDMNVARVRRWHCPTHEHLAEPGDFDSLLSGVRPDMTPIPDPDELAREQRADEQRAEQQRQRREAREAEAEAIRVARERYERANEDNDYFNTPIAGTPARMWR